MAPNLVRDVEAESTQEVIFSDIFEVRLADGTRVRGGFALWKRTRHLLGMAFDYGMSASLVVSTIQMLTFAVPGAIRHSEAGQTGWGRGNPPGPAGERKCRAILVRYDKKASNYLALIKLACLLIWDRRYVRLSVWRSFLSGSL